VVIGAMLVAPLMTPILALAASLVAGEAARLVSSLWVVVAGAVGAFGVAWVLSFLLSGPVTAEELTGEVLARTAPGLLDLGIAVAAGAAAAYILTDRGAGSALPGVAIAVALVPPLATVGITAEQGETAKAKGALLLFSTNLVAIVLAAAAVFLVTRFVDRAAVDFRRHRVSVGLAVAVCVTLAIAFPLALHTRDVVVDQQFESAVVDAVEEWDPQAQIVELAAEREGSRATIELAVASPVEPVPAWRLAELVSEREDLAEVEVTLRHRLELEDAASTSR
jgi:uncharacterized hydrophobic protein (TIGR00271 family)